MGNQAVCTLHHQGKQFSGKALLETSELIFRGEMRLKIPFASITTVQAHNGELHVRTQDNVAVFAVGSQAEKWRDKIINPKTLVQKLGVKSADTVALLGSFPAEFVRDLKKHGAAVADGRSKDARWYFLLAESHKDLLPVERVAKWLQGSAALWIVYPKGQKLITEHDVRGAGLAARLTDIKVASFSATHTALKFVVPRARR